MPPANGAEARSSGFSGLSNARSRTLDSVSDHVPHVRKARVVVIDDILLLAFVITSPVVLKRIYKLMAQVYQLEVGRDLDGLGRVGQATLYFSFRIMEK